jgi:hypothetical protein
VQFGNDHGDGAWLAAFPELASELHGRCEFRPSLQRVGTFAGFYLTIVGFDLAVLPPQNYN